MHQHSPAGDAARVLGREATIAALHTAGAAAQTAGRALTYAGGRMRGAADATLLAGVAVGPFRSPRDIDADVAAAMRRHPSSRSRRGRT